MISEYAIGTSYPPTNLELLSTPVSYPMQSFPGIYPVEFDRGDGSVAGHGFPFTTWTFQLLQQAEIDMLDTFWTVSGILVKSRALYIRTRKPEKHTEFMDYVAIGIRPKLQDYRQMNGTYTNVPFIFRRMEVYP